MKKLTDDKERRAALLKQTLTLTPTLILTLTPTPTLTLTKARARMVALASRATGGRDASVPESPLELTLT